VAPLDHRPIGGSHTIEAVMAPSRSDEVWPLRPGGVVITKDPRN
jgi:hypothetical protein